MCHIKMQAACFFLIKKCRIWAASSALPVTKMWLNVVPSTGGLYFRLIKHTDTNETWWTLMVSLWYPIIIFGILPAVYVVQKLRGTKPVGAQLKGQNYRSRLKTSASPLIFGLFRAV